jgi:hypothetical protein
MADRKGALIHEPAPPTQAHASDEPRIKVPACFGCGAIHGGVGAELLCLRAAVRAGLGPVRRKHAAEIAAKDQEIARLKRMLSEFNPKPEASS